MEVESSNAILIVSTTGRNKDSIAVEVLAGSLLTLLPRKDAQDKTENVFEVLDLENAVKVSCGVSDFKVIDPVVKDFLRPIIACKERLEVFSGKDWLNDGNKLKVGDQVYVKLKVDQSELPGILRFKGSDVPDSKGIYFGVELKDRVGTCDGIFRKKKLFKTDPEHAVFVALNKIRKNQESWHKSEKLYRQMESVQCSLQLGERVVWLSDNGPEKGTVRWIGVLPDEPEFNITVGVAFDNPVGTGTGKYKDKRLFYAKQKHACLIPLIGLITEEEFEKAMSQNNLPPLLFQSQPLSEIQPPIRKEPSLSKDRAATMNGNSFTMGDGSATSQKPTVNRNLRYIIIDGSNVAMVHGDNKVFSVEGLRICINYFVKRGHDKITAFVPEWRRHSENTPRSGRVLLEELGSAGYIKFTPARLINGKTIASCDDRFILNLAEKEEGIVVSNDQFQDLCKECASYQDIVANRLLQFLFVGDHFMPPDDPLGRHGLHLDDFLRYPHQPHKQSYTSGKDIQPPNGGEVDGKSKANCPQTNQKQNFEQGSRQMIRSPDVTAELFQKLSQMFPEPNQESKIRAILDNHKQETDLHRLTNYCINALFT